MYFKSLIHRKQDILKKHVFLKERKVNKIRTESGVWIPASYKSNRYSTWKEKSKIDATNDDNSEEEPSQIQKCM